MILDIGTLTNQDELSQTPRVAIGVSQRKWYLTGLLMDECVFARWIVGEKKKVLGVRGGTCDSE